MTKNELLALVVTVLEVAAGAPGGEVIEGHLYAALMGHVNLDDFHMLTRVLVDTGLATMRGHVLTITEKGREVAVAYAAAKKAAADAPSKEEGR